MNRPCLILPMARSRDPETSHQAARKAEAIAPTHRNIIMAALREAGPLTIYGIAAATGLDHVAVARRMVELQRLGLAAPNGRQSGGCREWQAA